MGEKTAGKKCVWVSDPLLPWSPPGSLPPCLLIGLKERTLEPTPGTHCQMKVCLSLHSSPI